MRIRAVVLLFLLQVSQQLFVSVTLYQVLWGIDITDCINYDYPGDSQRRRDWVCEVGLGDIFL